MGVSIQGWHSFLGVVSGFLKKREILFQQIHLHSSLIPLQAIKNISGPSKSRDKSISYVEAVKDIR